MRSSQSFFDNQSMPGECNEELTPLEELRQEKIKLEDVVANLKQTRNLFVMELDNKRDDISDYECFVEVRLIIKESFLIISQ